MKTPTNHNSAVKGDFAKTVLMPGDPLRSKYIAEKFLENVKLVNNVRGVHGYTGTYKGVPVSVMASGMGFPSMIIYATELYEGYGVENIIRVGSAGSINPKLKLKDVFLINGASSMGTLLSHSIHDVTLSAVASFNLLEKAKNICENNKIKYRIGNALSSNFLYEETSELAENLTKFGIEIVEMESAGLYYTASKCGKNALAICSVSDEIYSKKSLDSKERERGFDNMVQLALELAITYNN